jgi:hypothetical protein
MARRRRQSEYVSPSDSKVCRSTKSDSSRCPSPLAFSLNNSAALFRLKDPVLNSACYSLARLSPKDVVLQDAVMNELVDCSEMQYAVIEALLIEAGSERFVIPYRSKQALHDVIAEPCIIAFGFSSREEAAATANPCILAAAA